MPLLRRRYWSHRVSSLILNIHHSCCLCLFKLRTPPMYLIDPVKRPYDGSSQDIEYSKPYSMEI